MPISKEKNVSSNIERLAHSHPEFPPKQRVAVAFSEARRATHGHPQTGHSGRKSHARARALAENER
jgi:hypothetical protein